MSSTSKKKPRLITVGRGRAAPRAQTEDEARPGAERSSLSESRPAVPSVKPGLIKEVGAAELQRGSCSREDFSPGKEDNQLEEMKEELEMLKKVVGKLQKENDKVKEDFAVLEKENVKVKVKFAMFKEVIGANMDLLKKEVEKLQKEKDFEMKNLKTELAISKKMLDIEANQKGKVLPEVSPPSAGGSSGA